ncbi:MAG: hypothetical protein JWO52_2333 [Gammaproteobacteria bacterium]|jgi:predicted nuclease of predicted toxin-antitoxin system|nr:hypothetical protein [Gammaproteobacteria bacterium]
MFLIDECLTVQLVADATDHGYEAHHIAHLDMAGQRDWHIARHAQENDFVFVTNNAADFRALYATQELHPGLVIPVRPRRLAPSANTNRWQIIRAGIARHGLRRSKRVQSAQSATHLASFQAVAPSGRGRWQSE